MPPAVEQIAAPHLGMDTESAPVYVGKNNAQVVTNLLTGRPGRMPVRGSLPAPSAALWTASDAAIWAARSARLIAGRAGNTSLSRVDTDALTLTTITAANVDAVPGIQFTQVGDRVYGYGATGFLLYWDGGAAAPNAYNPQHVPMGSADITFWRNRLWCLGGTTAGDPTGTLFSDRVFWSDPLDGSSRLPDVLVSWSDDVSGLTNQIVLESLGGTNAPVGFGRLPSGLIAFGSKKGDLLRGSGPSDISLRAGAISRGCVSSSTIVEYGDTVMWLSTDGFFAFDGIEETELSGPIRSRITSDLRAVTLASPTTFYASAVRLPNDYVKLIFGNSTTGYALLYHVASKSWAYMTSPTLTPRRVCAATVGAQAIAYDGTRLWKLDDIVRPDILTFAGVDATTAGGTTPFTASVTSRLLRLTTPPQRARLAGLTVDTVASDSGWSVSAVDGDDTTVVASSAIGAGTGSRRHRTVSEVFGETDELAVTATYTGGGAPYAELHDIFVKYDPTRAPGSY